MNSNEKREKKMSIGVLSAYRPAKGNGWLILIFFFVCVCVFVCSDGGAGR